MADLGTLVRLDPREVWTHEALDFTPWLARNLDRLGAALGMDLALEQEEADAGDFSLDILATDLGTNRKVVIENQLYPTDHRHLGQLLTYAAHFEASAVVWVTSSFRDEHLRTLDWLNRVCGAGTSFFGVVVEVIRIDTSRPAVNLRVAVSPPEWQPTKSKAAGASSDGVSDRRDAYRRFFQRLIDELRETHRFSNAKIAQPQNWYSFSGGVSGLTYVVVFTSDNRVRVALSIDTSDHDANARVFEALQRQQHEVERALGEPLSWEPLEGQRGCRIALYQPGTIDDPQERLDQLHDWAVDRIQKLRAALGDRARAAMKSPNTTSVVFPAAPGAGAN